MATPKERINEIFQRIPDNIQKEIVDFAEYLEQKKKIEFEEALKNAPIDDEPLTAEEIETIKEAENELKTGQTISHDEFWSKHGQL